MFRFCALILQYCSNGIIALLNLAEALLGLYRPNGDGWLHSCLYCLDCWANSAFGGDPEETISSRAGKAMANGRPWGCVLCRFLDIFQRDHCQLAIERDEGRRAIIPDGE